MNKEIVDKYDSISNEARNIFLNKNIDYGDSYKDYGVIGILSRVNEKIKRGLNIEKNKITMVADENIRDTLLDLMNYAILGLIVLDEKI